MKVYKIITLCLAVSLCIEYGKCVPTFGNEYVHIKVHVPKEDDSSVHSLPAPAHKVVTHHYHHRRRPSKKGALGKSNHNALLESIILSEVNKPTISKDHLEYINHGGEIADHISNPLETYVVKKEHVKPKKVNTYTVVEEIKKIPYAHYSEQEHDQHDHVDTYKVIDTKPSYHSKAVENYPYSSHGPHTETFKVVDHNTHDSDKSYRFEHDSRPQIDTVKIVHDHTHFNQDDDNYHGERPQHHTKTVKIVETKSPTHHSYDHRNHYHGPSSHTDSIEIVNSKAPVESSSYYNGDYQNDDSYLQIKPDGGYNYARPSSDSGRQSYQRHQHHQQHDDSGYSAPFDSKPKYQDSYQYEHSTDDIAYMLGQKQYLPNDNFLPAKIVNSQNNYHFQGNVKQNTLLDDEVLAKTGGDFSHGYKYNSPKTSADAEWPPRESDYKASETYTGIDSYSVGHVQGVGSGGYSYSSPYP